VGHIQSGVEQAGDDADFPRVACRSAAMQDQRSITRSMHRPRDVDLLLIVGGRQPGGGRRLCDMQS
jgi:hypothetical protein